MRDRMERFVVLPVFMGCVSQSDVIEVGTPHSKKTKPKSESIVVTRGGQDGDKERSSGVSLKNSGGFYSFPKPNINFGIHKLLITSSKSLAQVFVYKEESDEEDEMIIGSPTDVKHVTHIGIGGCDGSTCTSSPLEGNGWENRVTPETTLSLPSISLRQFDEHDPFPPNYT